MHLRTWKKNERRKWCFATRIQQQEIMNGVFSIIHLKRGFVARRSPRKHSPYSLNKISTWESNVKKWFLEKMESLQLSTQSSVIVRPWEQIILYAVLWKMCYETIVYPHPNVCSVYAKSVFFVNLLGVSFTAFTTAVLTHVRRPHIHSTYKCDVEHSRAVVSMHSFYW